MRKIRVPLLVTFTIFLASCGGTPTLQVPELSPIDPLALSAGIGQETTGGFSVKNTGTGPLNYVLTTRNAPWLKVNQGVSGTVAPGKEVNVHLQATCGNDAEDLLATVMVTATGVKSVDVPVTLTCISDTTPDNFAFALQGNVEPGASMTSNEIIVSGINTVTPITVTGGTLLINGQVSTAATVRPGDKVSVRVTASTAAGGTAAATVTIGGVSSTFTVTTAETLEGYWVLNLNKPSDPNLRIWLNVFESGPEIRGVGNAGYVNGSEIYIEPYSGPLTGSLNSSQYTLTLFIKDFYDTNEDVKYEFKGAVDKNVLNGTWTRTNIRLGFVSGSGTFTGMKVNNP